MCYSLMLTTCALDNATMIGLKYQSQDYRESDFLMAGNSVRWFTKLKAFVWNASLTGGIILLATTLAYPAELKWRRYLI